LATEPEKPLAVTTETFVTVPVPQAAPFKVIVPP
jgi:hypothetical protein